MEKPEWMTKFEDLSLDEDERLDNGLEFAIPMKDGKIHFERANEVLKMFDLKDHPVSSYYYAAFITYPIWQTPQCRWFFEEMYNKAKSLDPEEAEDLMKGYTGMIEDFDKKGTTGLVPFLRLEEADE